MIFTKEKGVGIGSEFNYKNALIIIFSIKWIGNYFYYKRGIENDFY